MLIKALRIGLGQLVVFADWVSRPRKLKRSPEAQAEVERATANLALYQFHACPFCVKVRRTLHLSLIHILLEVGLSARWATIGWPLEMPPRMPPALLERKPSGVSSSRCCLLYTSRCV